MKEGASGSQWTSAGIQHWDTVLQGDGGREGTSSECYRVFQVNVNVRNIQICRDFFVNVYLSQTNDMLGSKISGAVENKGLQFLLYMWN